MECFLSPSLSSPTPFFPRRRIISCKKEKKHKLQKKKKNRSTTHGGNTTHPLPYPKASPTPLLLSTSTNTHPLTRTQFLDNLLLDLESSISNGILVPPSTFSSLLESCYQSGHLSHGLRLHRLIPPRLLRNSADLSSKLLRLYSALGHLDRAHHLFDEMHPRARSSSAFAWNSLISGYTDAGLHEDALALYFQMEEDGVPADLLTFPRVLKACAGLRSLPLGEAAHRHALRSGHSHHPVVLNSLIDMYAKCGDLVRSLRAFRSIPFPNTVSWNSILAAYSLHGLDLQTIALFREMLLSTSLTPDPFTLTTLLVSGARTIHSRRLGREIHGWALRHGLHDDIPLANALITMYAECHLLPCARSVFESMEEKDAVSWNAIISAHRKEKGALTLFYRMIESGISPDRITFVSVLSACAKLGFVEEGRGIFAEMEGRYGIEAGMEHCSCMVSLLGRSGSVEEAYEFVLQRVGTGRGSTVWGALLYACFIHGNVKVGEIAAEWLFELEPDNVLNFQLMMDLYRKVGREADADKVWRMMTARGLDS